MDNAMQMAPEPLPEQGSMLRVAEPALSGPIRVALYNDADNQSPQTASVLVDVGQALAKIVYKTPAERKRVIATFPGLRERGAHPHKLLVF